MANNSICINRTGPTWPLGFIQVANNGTPSGNLMSLVDPNGLFSPNGPANGGVGSEYTVRFKSIVFQGYKPAANNAGGWIPNTGNVYILQPGNNGAVGNRSDTGCVVGIISANGGAYALPASLAAAGMQLSPYEYTLDSDVNGEGAIVVGYQPAGN